MSKHLFLEGPIQTGKSTLIRHCLGEHLTECGGFTSQRLIGADGSTKGFRIGPACATPLTAEADGPGPDTFKYFREDGTVLVDQSVFETVGVSLLTSGKSRPLILLDEIGGSELLCPRFYHALYEILSGDIPCLGVLKLHENARRLQNQYAEENRPTIADLNLALRRKILDECGGQILYYERTGSSSDEEDTVRNELTGFIRTVFS